MAVDGVKCKMPQFSGLKGQPGSLPDGPYDNDLRSTGKSGKAGRLGSTSGGSGVRSHRTRQSTGNKVMKGG